MTHWLQFQALISFTKKGFPKHFPTPFPIPLSPNWDTLISSHAPLPQLKPLNWKWKQVQQLILYLGWDFLCQHLCKVTCRTKIHCRSVITKTPAPVFNRPEKISLTVIPIFVIVVCCFVCCWCPFFTFIFSQTSHQRWFLPNHKADLRKSMQIWWWLWQEQEMLWQLLPGPHLHRLEPVH